MIEINFCKTLEGLHVKHAVQRGIGWHEVRPTPIYEFSSYLTGDTLRLRY
jgi:hypothetical protein